MKKEDCVGCPHLKEITDDNGSGKKYYRKYCLMAKPFEIYVLEICPILSLHTKIPECEGCRFWNTEIKPDYCKAISFHPSKIACEHKRKMVGK